MSNLAEHVTKNPDSGFSKYMINLCLNMSIDMSKIDVTKFDTSKEKPEDLNPILFEQVSELQKEEVLNTEPSLLLNQYKSELDNIKGIINPEQRLRRKQDELNSTIRNIAERVQVLNRICSDKTTKESEIQALKLQIESGNFDAKVFENIARIEEQGWWKFLAFSRSADSTAVKSLYFQTGVVHQRYVNIPSEIDHQVIFGQYMVEIPIRENGFDKMRVYPLFKNPIRFGDSSQHPHISIGGTICWGSGSDRAASLFKDLALQELLETLRSLLMTYEPSNPYTALTSFSTDQISYYKHQEERLDSNFYQTPYRNATPDPSLDMTKPLDLEEALKVGTLYLDMKKSGPSKLRIVTSKASSNGITSTVLMRFPGFSTINSPHIDNVQRVMDGKLSELLSEFTDASGVYGYSFNEIGLESHGVHILTDVEARLVVSACKGLDKVLLLRTAEKSSDPQHEGFSHLLGEEFYATYKHLINERVVLDRSKCLFVGVDEDLDEQNTYGLLDETQLRDIEEGRESIAGVLKDYGEHECEDCGESWDVEDNTDSARIVSNTIDVTCPECGYEESIGL